jgi:hypothetical protein
MRPQFHVLPLVEKTAFQVSVLRSIVDTASEVLSPSRGPFDSGAQEGFDPESRAAARKTLVLAFHQLDNLIDDQSRWGSAPVSIESEALRLLKAEGDKVTADAAMRATLTQPFFLFQARLFRTSTGRFRAADATEAIVGWGDTPKEAVEAFNAAFERPSAPPPGPTLGGQVDSPPSVSAPAQKAPSRRKKPLL